MKTLRLAAILAATLAATACSGESPTAPAPADTPAHQSSVMGTGAKEPVPPPPGSTEP
jgi:ABC-type glycerol-3-phosphate transport system substrate-binding protein